MRSFVFHVLFYVSFPLLCMGQPAAETNQAAAGASLSEEEQVLFEEGQATFLTLCAACHQATGQGIAGLSKPLVGSRWAVGPEEAVIRIVLQGKRSEGLPAPMAPLSGLTDRQIAAALTYVRRSWGHEASAVTPDAVAEIRAATQGRTDPWTDEDLEQLVGE